MESYGFAHVTLDDHYLMHDCGKLRAHFNELFDDMYAAKEREISAIRERNERIRHIDSELRIMFGQSVPRVPVDPRWHPKVNMRSADIASNGCPASRYLNCIICIRAQ